MSADALLATPGAAGAAVASAGDDVVTLVELRKFAERLQRLTVSAIRRCKVCSVATEDCTAPDDVTRCKCGLLGLCEACFDRYDVVVEQPWCLGCDSWLCEECKQAPCEGFDCMKLLCLECVKTTPCVECGHSALFCEECHEDWDCPDCGETHHVEQEERRGW